MNVAITLAEHVRALRHVPEGRIDPKNDLVRIMLVQVADGLGDAPWSVVMQIGEAAVE